MAGDDRDSLGKVSTLSIAAEFIQWRRKIKAYLGCSDPLLAGLKPKPSCRKASDDAIED